MYRDIFDLIVPGWMYLMALLFALFGTTLSTARVATAIIHGGTGALLFVTCRRLGVRPAIALSAALVFLALCPTAWPIASQHWLATLLCVVLLLICLPRRIRVRSAFVAGIVVGLIITVQQQRGLIMGAAVLVFALCDAIARRHDEMRSPGSGLITQLLALSAGVLLVVVPFVVSLLASAGFGPVWRALVIQPVVYRDTIRCHWGHLAVMMPYTFPRVFPWLPLILLVSVPRLVVTWARGDEHGAPRVLIGLVIFCLFSLLSIAYYPDIVHIAFVAPIFFIAIAEALESLLRRARSFGMVLGRIVAVAVLCAATAHLYGNLIRLREEYPDRLATKFGRIDVGRRSVEGDLYQKLDVLLRDVPSRAFYCYRCAHWYLLLDAQNPTRYQVVLPGGYTSSDQVQEIIDGLAAADVPYMLAPNAMIASADPIATFIRDRYEPLPGTSGVFRMIFRKRPPEGG